MLGLPLNGAERVCLCGACIEVKWWSPRGFEQRHTSFIISPLKQRPRNSLRFNSPLKARGDAARPAAPPLSLSPSSRYRRSGPAAPVPPPGAPAASGPRPRAGPRARSGAGRAEAGAARCRGEPAAAAFCPSPSRLHPGGRQRRCAAPGPGREGPGAERGQAEARLDGRGRGRARPALAAAAGGGPGRRGAAGARRMAAGAAGSITTLPALPDDGGGGAFPPGHFKDPKRLYCKNGGFFLRINPDGRVDGVREKSDPHSEWPGRSLPVPRVGRCAELHGRRCRVSGRLFSASPPSSCCAPGLARCTGFAYAPKGVKTSLRGSQVGAVALSSRLFGPAAHR